jgi:hypothetical protein
MIHWRNTLGGALGRPASWLCAIAVVSSVVVYANALNNPFVYDDFRMIVENQAIACDPGNSELRASIAHVTQGRIDSLAAGGAGRMP